MITLTVNGQSRQVAAEADTPLLWILREDLGLTGSRFGCGVGACGACTVHMDGVAVRACSIPLVAAAGARITTIEGLPASAGLAPDTMHPVQQAWIDLQVPQCGYCQSGMIMAAAALLQANPKPTDAEIDAAITNLCRCGTYPRVRRAIHRLAGEA